MLLNFPECKRVITAIYGDSVKKDKDLKLRLRYKRYYHLINFESMNLL
jgi:hypothetical protein